MLGGNMSGITREQLSELTSDRNVVLLDVRSPEEFAEGTVPGAKNVLPDRLADESIPRDALVVTVCNHGGPRSQGAANALRERGIDARFLVGGVKGPRAGH
jgi:rhodanese-related sulfurtransferase